MKLIAQYLNEYQQGENENIAIKKLYTRLMLVVGKVIYSRYKDKVRKLDRKDFEILVHTIATDLIMRVKIKGLTIITYGYLLWFVKPYFPYYKYSLCKDALPYKHYIDTSDTNVYETSYEVDFTSKKDAEYLLDKMHEILGEEIYHTEHAKTTVNLLILAMLNNLPLHSMTFANSKLYDSYIHHFKEVVLGDDE